MRKEKNGTHSSDENSDSDSSSSSSSSSSNSSESSRSSSSSSSLDQSPSPKSKPKPSRSASASTGNNVPEWDQDPELYGIRRSGRSRKEPSRLQANDSDDSEEEEVSKPLKRNVNSVWNENSSYTESENESYVPKSKPIFNRQKKNRGRPSKGATSSNNKKKKQRKGDGSSDSADNGFDDDDEYRRFSRRRNQVSDKKISYVIPDSDEDIDDDENLVASWTYEDDTNNATDGTAATEDVHTVEKVLDHRRGFKGVTGAGTTIYNVKAKGEPPHHDDQEIETQYLINWKGLSHLHNTWESEESLIEASVKGMKKLHNYAARLAEYENWKKHANPEDLEYNECQLEMTQQLTSSYVTPERIIAERTIEGGESEYYVKWANLPYVDATWEAGSLIENENRAVIENFRIRQESRYTPSSKSKWFKYRPKFQSIKSQPSFIGGNDTNLILRDYQLDGINWLVHAWCKQNSVILADEMGLGKTIQTISFLYYLFHTYQLYGPFLIVVPLSTLDAWQREFARWAPDINVLSYVGDVNSRSIIRDNEWTHPGNKRHKFNAILTTYEIVLKDKPFLITVPWAVIMVDEAHRLKNEDSMLYKCLQDLTVYHRLLITGTPLQNSLKELWSLLHFIMPEKFDNWNAFNEQFGTTSAEKRGYTKLHKLLEPFILRRVKKDVEKSLPAKVERILRVDMSRKQKQFYKWILTRNFAALTKGLKGSTVSFVNIVMELKKCCNHSFLTRPEEMELTVSMSKEEKLQYLLKGSGKLLLLDKLLVRLKETGHRVLIFSQMVRVLDILADYLELRRFAFQRLDGGIKGELRKQALEHFNAPGSLDFCFLLSTRAGGLGINLATADTVIIFDSDWNPQNDLQAQARAHRIGQKDQVNVYRLVTMNSVEEEIIERAKKKMILDHLVIQRMDTTGTTILNKPKSQEKSSNPFSKEELSAILKFGAEDLFKDDDESEEEPKCDIDEILNRAETREETNVSAGDEILSAFKVASFAVDEDEPISLEKPKEEKEWTDIIPQELRDKIEDEERQKEMECLYLGPRNRKTVGDGNSSKRKRASDDEDEDSDNSDAEKPSKKRGRPCLKERITGFTDTEIRRFIKAYKRFPRPLDRLEALATDSELQEKAMNDLNKLAITISNRCQDAVHEASEEAQDSSKPKPVSVKIGNVSVNAKTLCDAVNLLEPLGRFMPLLKNENDRSPWDKVTTLPFKFKDPGYDGIEWGMIDDVNLLKGIYLYGIGSWDSIKMDNDLGLRDKIMPNADRKPQAKHLDSRALHLLKSLKKNLDGGGNAPKRTRGPRTKKAATSGLIGTNENSNDSKYVDTQSSDSKYKSVDIIENTDSSNDEEDKNDKVTKKENIDDRNREKIRVKKSKRDSKPIVHITAKSEPIVIGELEPEVFVQCKEMMRTVKKSLKSLDRPDQTLGESEKAHHNRYCLLQIGKHIDSLLHKMNSEEKIRDWRSNLWCFVSKFTEHDAKKLYKLYRHALKRKHREKNDDPVKRTSVIDKPSSSSSSYRSSYNLKNNSNFRREDGGNKKTSSYNNHSSSNDHFNKYQRKGNYDGHRSHHSHHGSVGVGGSNNAGHRGDYSHDKYKSHHHHHNWSNGSSSSSYGNQAPSHRKHDWRGQSQDYR